MKIQCQGCGVEQLAGPARCPTCNQRFPAIAKRVDDAPQAVIPAKVSIHTRAKPGPKPKGKRK